MTDQPDITDFVADNVIHADKMLREKLDIASPEVALPPATFSALRAMPANFQEALGGPILDKLIAYFHVPAPENANPLLWRAHQHFYAADEVVAAALTDAFALAMQNASAQAQSQSRSRPRLLRTR